MINQNAIKVIEGGCTVFNNAKKDLFDAASDLAIAYQGNDHTTETNHLFDLVLKKIERTEESLGYFRRCVEDCRP